MSPRVAQIVRMAPAIALLSAAGCGSAPAPAGNHPAASGLTTAPPKGPAITGGSQPRRVVKVATDPDAAKIDKTPKDTTVEDIVAQKPPAGAKLAGRVAPFETQEWRVKCTLKSVQLMKDGDFYLVMQGDKGGETVVEVPNPAQCTDSPLASEITAAREQIADKYHPTDQVKVLNDPATVTGVGFLGWGNAKKGAKGRTGARLMPGTGFKFEKKTG